MKPAPPTACQIRVWDPAVRLAHWALVLSIAISWISTLGWGLSWDLHEPAGYVAAGVVGLRLLWGWLGSAHARFGDFVRGPGAVWSYTRDVFKGREPHYIGHNPLGGWMVLALLTMVSATAGTGWLLTTDRFWGSETMAEVHHFLAWSLLGLIALHLGGVLFTSRRQRENLVAAMVTGHKVRKSRQSD